MVDLCQLLQNVHFAVYPMKFIYYFVARKSPYVLGSKSFITGDVVRNSFYVWGSKR